MRRKRRYLFGFLTFDISGLCLVCKGGFLPVPSGVALLDRAWLDLDMPFGVFRLADLFSAVRAGGASVRTLL